jgi:serine/threonine protein kinase
LAYLSDRKICHTHISIQNILVENDKVFKIINFSDALELTHSDAADYQHKNILIDEYFAPEMKNGYITQKSDIYSLGLVF